MVPIYISGSREVRREWVLGTGSGWDGPKGYVPCTIRLEVGLGA